MTSPAFVIMSKLKNDASVDIVHDIQIPTINYSYNLLKRINGRYM